MLLPFFSIEDDFSIVLYRKKGTIVLFLTNNYLEKISICEKKGRTQRPSPLIFEITFCRIFC